MLRLTWKEQILLNEINRKADALHKKLNPPVSLYDFPWTLTLTMRDNSVTIPVWGGPYSFR